MKPTLSLSSRPHQGEKSQAAQCVGYRRSSSAPSAFIFLFCSSR
jgi:hypothetical protein